MHVVVVEWLSVKETVADGLDKQLRVEENHDCSWQTWDIAANWTYDSCLQYFMWWWWRKTMEMWFWWRRKTMEMWWCWWWRNNGNVVLEENNRIVVVEEHNRNVVVVVEENYRILWRIKLYQCATFYLFLSLHSAPEELTWVGSVPFAKNPLVEKIVRSEEHTSELQSPT